MTPEERRDLREYMARTLFVQAWAAWSEQYGHLYPEGHYPAGCELMDYAPATCQSAYEAADTLIAKIEEEVAPIEVVVERARATWKGNTARGVFIDELGYCLAMSSLGHGVGWTDYHEPFEGHDGVYFDYSYYDIPDDICPIPDKEDCDEED